MVQLGCAVILCLSLFGQSVIAKPGYAAGYDVDYYVSVKVMNFKKKNNKTNKTAFLTSTCQQSNQTN